jgi:acetyl-CoA acetyltransferase
VRISGFSKRAKGLCSRRRIDPDRRENRNQHGGGLISKGHPVGATGLGQVFEIVKQLRSEHENQVKNAEIGLTHNLGATG